MKDFRGYLKEERRLAEERIAAATYSLQALYRDLNQQLFGGELNQVPIAFGKTPKNAAGVTNGKAIRPAGAPKWLMKTVEGSISVVISPYTYEEDVLKGIVAHEMIHVWCMQFNKHDATQHGGYFLTKLHHVQAKASFKIPVSHEPENEERGPEKEVVFVAGAKSGTRYLCFYGLKSLQDSDMASNAQAQMDTLQKYNRYDWAAVGVAKTRLASSMTIKRELKKRIEGGYNPKSFADLNVQRVIASVGTPNFG